MIYFIKQHQKIIAVQLFLILLVGIMYFFSTKHFISSITIHPIYTDVVVKSRNGAPLTRSYTPSFAMNLYLQELSINDVRAEIFSKFITENEFNCENLFMVEPSIQTYKKEDKSFPVSAEFTSIQVKSACSDFPKKYASYLSNSIHDRVIEKIQKVENEALSYIVETLKIENENDLTDLEAFLSARKENLSNLIPLLNNDAQSTYANSYHHQILDNFRGNKSTIKNDLHIPLSANSAKAELNFLKAISSDLTKSSIGILSRINRIEQYKSKHDFSDAKLINISEPEEVIKSRRNLYLSVFFIFIIICVGYVLAVLTDYKNHKKLK